MTEEIHRMRSGFLLYGSTGFVGSAIAQLAVQRGLRPLIAGRNAAKVKAQAQQLGLEYRVFHLSDSISMDRALSEITAVLHCAGPFIHTSRQLVEGCLRTGTHYLDITGEIPVFEALAARDEESKAKGVMILPGVGFDVVPTDCLAVHLKQRLPSAARLTLAFHSQGPAGIPPGTARTMTEMLPYGNKIRRNGRLESPPGVKTRWIDFGQGPIQAAWLPWGDVFTAYYSTGIPNIEAYAAVPSLTRQLMALTEVLRPLFRLAVVRSLARRFVKTGSTADERARTRSSVWGEVEDDQGHKAVSRLHGPEAGVDWTALTALECARRASTGNVSPGFQTPSRVYGADFVLECGGATREDLE